MSADIIAHKQQLPAFKKPKSLWKMLDKLASNADDLVERLDGIMTIQRSLWQHESRLGRGETVGLPTQDNAKLNGDDRDALAFCREALAVLDPPSYYDDDDELLKAYVVKRLAALMESIPQKAGANAVGYSTMLLEHVMAIDELRYVVLDVACREVAEAKPFLPSPSELTTALREQKALWDKRLLAIDTIESRARGLSEHITKLASKFGVELAARAAVSAQQELDYAAAKAKSAADAMIVKQTASAAASRSVQEQFKYLAECQTEVAEKAQALAEATKLADEARAKLPPKAAA